MPDDAHLLAVLADAEILRHQLALTEELLQAERKRIADLVRQLDTITRQLESLERRAAAAEERQREANVLLLHRDEEIARLHEYLRSAWQRPEPEPAPEVEPPQLAPPEEPRRRALTTEERIVAQLASDVAAAGRWLGRVVGGKREGE